MTYIKRLYPVLLIIIVYLVWLYRNNNTLQEISVYGNTMGTTYSVKYLMDKPVDYKTEIDSILVGFNLSLSTYIPDSEISLFNQDSVLTFESPYFLEVLKKSKEIHNLTHGAFDPTVMPLVNAWGFGPESSKLPTAEQIDSLLQLVGFEKIFFNEQSVAKKKNGVALDFSAIAKGYGVDVVSEFLSNKGIENFFVEIGGEVRTAGVNQNGVPWRIGIEDPTSSMNNRQTNTIVGLSDRAMATSGNYRNFYMKDGIKYAHTIDPSTGYTVDHSMLSVSVFADDCMTADAYATSFMVMGKDKSLELLENLPDIDVFLIFGTSNGELETYASPGIKKMIVNQDGA